MSDEITTAANAASAPKTITITINHPASMDPAKIYILLSGGSSADGILPANTAVCLDKLNNGQFTLASGSGVGRLYISFDNSVSVGEPFNSSTRFDWVELTYNAPGLSQCNLTAVDQFGIPLSLEAKGGSTGTRKWNISANALISKLNTIAPAAEIKSGSSFVRIISPQHAGSAVYTVPSWASYLSSLSAQTITIKDRFLKEGQDPIDIDYSGTFAADGTIVLSGTMTQSGTAISNPDSVTVFGPKPSFPPPTSPAIPQLTFVEQIDGANGPYFRSSSPSTYHTAGENNEYSVIYRDLISSLQNGFMGGKYGNSTDDWAGKAPFAAARTTPDGFFNHYAEVIDAASDGEIYGYAFSDNTTNPLLTFTDSSELIITILSDTDVAS